MSPLRISSCAPVCQYACITRNKTFQTPFLDHASHGFFSGNSRFRWLVDDHPESPPSFALALVIMLVFFVNTIVLSFTAILWRHRKRQQQRQQQQTNSIISQTNEHLEMNELSEKGELP
jgi:hypothetical protein